MLDFATFFHAVHGTTPLPWQTRLAKRLVETHSWPDLIDLPTASGKTACIDIAVFHLGQCALRNEAWRAARRILFVVDRRIIVDAAYERAEKIGATLLHSQDAAVKELAAALAKITDGAPLVVQKLRGGMPRERGFTHDPSQPMVITTTVDQIGSRLLFRGYGLSQYSSPLHAGLLGHDTLVLLDEAHLSVPFLQTVEAVRREQARAESAIASVQAVKLVPLSATAQSKGERFRLSEEDLRNPLIAQRRTAPKPSRLVTSKSKLHEKVDTLLRQTLSIFGEIDMPAPAVAVIVNRVSSARALFTKLATKRPENCDVKLMIGRSRPLDRDRLAEELVNRVRAGRQALSEDRGIIVVATQTIEVGADLDFHGLVTECASLDALKQRFGRLDRLGIFRKARAAIIGEDYVEEDPVYGTALRATWEWLRAISSGDDENATIDFSIEAMEAKTASADIGALFGKPREALQLTPSHVELLCQTSPRPMYDPDVSALLHGFDGAAPDVQVIFRDSLPTRTRDECEQIDDGETRLVNELLTLLPPSTLETLSLPIASVRSWLGEMKSSAELSDLEGADSGNDMKEIEESRRDLLVWRRIGETWKATSVRGLRPGDTIVVPTTYGGCDRFGFAPDSKEAASDLAQAARVSLHREQIELITERSISAIDCDTKDKRRTWRILRDAFSSGESSSSELRQAMLKHLAVTALSPDLLHEPVETLARNDGSLFAVVLRDGIAGDEDISDEDISSSRTVRILLNDHNAGVGSRARRLATLVGLDADQCETLGCAGDVHDVGKADPRFQRLLGMRQESASIGDLLAKGTRRSRSNASEQGERHEAYSVALIRKYPTLLAGAKDKDLATYLIGTHHGRGRGLMPTIADAGAYFQLTVKDEVLSFEGAPQLSALNSQWANLFWRLTKRYGAWGLAYLEAVLRLADHLQSRDEITGAIRYD